MDMVEKVARAIRYANSIESGYSKQVAEHNAETEWDLWVNEARAAIAAMKGAILDFAYVYEGKGFSGDAETIRAVADELMRSDPPTRS